MATNIRATLLLESEGGTSAVETLIAARPFRITDVWGVVSVQGDAGNVTTLRRDPLTIGAYASVSSALDTNGAANSVQRTTSVVLAQDDVVAGDSVQWTTSGGNGLGRLIGYAKIIPRPIAGA